MYYTGVSQSIFVSSKSYPNAFVGAVTLTNPNEVIDNPKKWFGMDYRRIIYLRSNTLVGGRLNHIKNKNRLVERIQEVALSSKPVCLDLDLTRKPKFGVRFSNIVQPMGPMIKVKDLRLSSNPRIEKRIEKALEPDLKAEDSVKLLYESVDVYKAVDILSSGVLGVKDKRLVPTRWSITAVDDIIGKHLISKIKEHKELSDYVLLESEFLGNHYLILLLPGKWEFECHEVDSSVYNYEYEPYFGRKKYAEKERGGYYAARLGVLEGLDSIRRQARVVVIREISPSYNVPLGVWVCRETVRNAWKNKKVFQTRKELLEYANSRLKNGLNFYTKNSRILTQSSLRSFLSF